MTNTTWQPFGPPPRSEESATSTDPWIALCRHVSIIGLAGVISGLLVGGIGGRIVMAVSAANAQSDVIGRLTENGNRIGQFTIGGTVALLVFVGLLEGVFAGVALVGVEPWVSRSGPLHGLLIGALALAVVGVTTFESRDFRIIDPAGLNVAMFLGLFLLFGYSVVLIARLLNRWMPAARQGTLPLYLAVVSLGAIPLLMNALFFTSAGFCGCDPWYLMGGLVLSMTLATVALHVARIKRWDRWAGVARVIGIGTFLAIVTLGLTRLYEEIATIV